jgi:hypothetical protein
MGEHVHDVFIRLSTGSLEAHQYPQSPARTPARAQPLALVILGYLRLTPARRPRPAPAAVFRRGIYSVAGLAHDLGPGEPGRAGLNRLGRTAIPG